MKSSIFQLRSSLLGFLLLTAIYSPSWQGASIDVPEWEGVDVVSGGQELLPGELPGAGTSSPGADGLYIYEARLACTDGDYAIFPECATVMPDCIAGVGNPSGEAGTAIYWYYASKISTPSVWVFFSGPECVYGEKPRDVLAEIAAQIAQEFQRTPVAPATIGSQPGTHTLRGNETNVWAQAAIQTFNLTMIGQRVSITATPVAYTWNYGDGTVWGPHPLMGHRCTKTASESKPRPATSTQPRASWLLI